MRYRKIFKQEQRISIDSKTVIIINNIFFNDNTSK